MTTQTIADLPRGGETATRRSDVARRAAPQAGGLFWFAGWLFTIGYAQLVWWKIPLGIVIWPYLLGVSLR
jgi:hypothetical protein